MPAADLLVLVPWLMFGAGLAVIGFRLRRRTGRSRRQRRHLR